MAVVALHNFLIISEQKQPASSRMYLPQGYVDSEDRQDFSIYFFFVIFMASLLIEYYKTFPQSRSTECEESIVNYWSSVVILLNRIFLILLGEMFSLVNCDRWLENIPNLISGGQWGGGCFYFLIFSLHLWQPPLVNFFQLPSCNILQVILKGELLYCLLRLTDLC